MTEFELIRRYFVREPARRVDLGIGDDCALLRPLADPPLVSGRGETRRGGLSEGAAGLAVSTDMLVAGRHFFEDVAPADLGYKALAVNLSDLAAMGARPRAFLLAMALPAADDAWLHGFARGLFEIADRFDCELVGGDTTRGPLNVCVTVFGDCPVDGALRRDHAEPDDDVWVSGELGAAALAVRRRLEGAALPADHPAWKRLLRPEPRIELGLSLRHLASSAIDLSDGLIGDLAHVADRSRVGIDIEWANVPVSPVLDGLDEPTRLALALAGGDDYELLFTAAAANRDAVAGLSRRLGLPLTRIGRVRSGSGVGVTGPKGQTIDHALRAFDHFA